MNMFTVQTLSLQSLSFDVIAKNFTRFHFAFNTSKDERLQRNLEILRRRFTNQLAEKLLNFQGKIDTYFDFFVSKYLTSLEFIWFSKSPYLKSLSDIFCRLPNLSAINLYSHGDEILKNIAEFCPRIVEISSLDTDLTDKGIEYLCATRNGKLPCPELKNITLKFSCVTKEAAECLIRTLPSIEKFFFPDLPVLLHDIHIRNPQEVHFYNLTELDFTASTGVERNCTVSTAEVLRTCVTVCPKLEHINCCLTKKEELDALYNSHLKKLALRFEENSNSNVNIDDFIKYNGHNLIELIATDCVVSASILSVHCPALKNLHIQNVEFIYEYNRQVIFPSLNRCAILYDNIDDTVVKVFRLLSSSSPKLEFMIFSSCTLTWELKHQILLWCVNPLIKKIVFMCMHLEINFLKDFFLNCSSLEHIALLLCTYDVSNPHESVNAILAKHPNNPIIHIK